MVVGEAMPGPPGISGLGGEAGQELAGRLGADPKDSGLSSPALREALSDGWWWEEVGKVPVVGGGSPTPGRLNRDSSSHQASNTGPGCAGNRMPRLWTWVDPEPTF